MGKDKIYKTQDLGLEFGKSVFVTTYGNWLLMQDPLLNLYIVNLFTQERINLPHVDSQPGTSNIKDNESEYESRGVFWIDEKTKDYVVIWGLKKSCAVYYKKGDTSWNQIPETTDFFDMVYKNHKLYFLSRFGSFKIFDFSGEIPREIFQCGVVMDEYVVGLKPRVLPSWDALAELLASWRLVIATKLVVTVTGDVLKVDKMRRNWTPEWSFGIYKIYSSASGCLKKCEQVDSLGDEVMLFDRGITVLANGSEGFDRNSICFIDRHAANKAMLLFNLGTRKVKDLDNFNCPSIQFSVARCRHEYCSQPLSKL